MWKRIVSAIEESDAHLVSFYLAQDPAVVFEQNYQDETLLHFAAQKAELPIIIELVNLGSRADIPDDFGWTPLHQACNSGNEQAVALFIKTDICLNMKTKKEETPLHIATRHNFHSIIARLCAAGADKNIKNRTGNTALHIAAQNGFAKSVEVLVAAGADVRACNEEGSTPLHLNAVRGHIECAELLLENCADPEQQDNSGRNFFNIADIFGKDKYIMSLRAKFPRLSESSSTKTTQKMNAINERPSLESYFGDNQPGQSLSNNKTNVENVLRGLILGKGSRSGQNHIITAFETLLWFLVFPLLLFILWEGFARYILPPIITLNITPENRVQAEFMQTFLNSAIVFAISCMLVTSEKPSLSCLHFVKDARDAVHFRVMHFALIEFHYYEQIIHTPEFLTNFGIFWLWFVTVYSISYLIWWANTHPGSNGTKETEVYQVQN